jgi:hypothetical protein
MHIFITASSHHVACKIAVIVITVYKVNFLLEHRPQNAGNSLSELQEIQNFLGGMPPHPFRQLAPSVLDSVVSES